MQSLVLLTNILFKGAMMAELTSRVRCGWGALQTKGSRDTGMSKPKGKREAGKSNLEKKTDICPQANVNSQMAVQRV